MAHISIRMEEGLAPVDVRPPIFDWAYIIKNLREAKIAETPDALAKVCIYRVPKALRDVNPHAFDPQIVSIGPYHRGKEGLRDMDIHKWRCFHRIIRRSKLSEVFFFNSIGEVVSEARRCYEGTIQISDGKFVEIMVLDGCFLLEIFQGYSDDFERLGYSPYDQVFSFGSRALDFIGLDVKRLENQVPLFILERLLGLITNEMKDKKDQVIGLALNFFRVTTPHFDPLPIVKYRNCVHCLDIYRQSLFDDEITPFAKKPMGSLTKQLTIPCVTKLREAGIKFKKRETNCFFGIQFGAGVLHIPMLLLEENIIRREFPNLIAFEQCHLDCSNHVTSYAKFMDDLIDSSDDVAYLHDHGIIDPFGWGSYKEAANFFNSIVREVFFNSHASYLSKITTDLSEEVRRYHDTKTRNWTVKIKRMYFANPWSIISLFAAIFLLVLTFLATYYGMYGYYKPRS